MCTPWNKSDEDFAQPDHKQLGPEGFIVGVKEKPSTRFKHPPDLAKGLYLSGYMLQYIKTCYGIHGIIVEGKPFGGA